MSYQKPERLIPLIPSIPEFKNIFEVIAWIRLYRCKTNKAKRELDAMTTILKSIGLSRLYRARGYIAQHIRARYSTTTDYESLYILELLAKALRRYFYSVRPVSSFISFIEACGMATDINTLDK